MLVAAFYRGPFDGERLMLPCEREDPWARFVIPTFGRITLEHFYLYSGWGDDLALYLYDESTLLTTSGE